jgi:protein MpaA
VLIVSPLVGALALAGVVSLRVDGPVRDATGSLSSRRAAQAALRVRRRFDLGRSVRGHRIEAVELGDPRSRHRLLVIGCIHGNEVAGIAIARRLTRGSAPADEDLWVVEDLNPDGVAANTRQNASGVDLNRNFPLGWRPIGRRGDQQYSGSHPLSEPEARIAHTLIMRIRPAITVWFHQPRALVDESGGDVRVERRLARLMGLPLRRLTRYPGSAAGWQNHRLPGTTAVVVELPPGPPPARRLARYAHALLELAR